MTRSPISTISYNTESFLKEKLDDLVQSHIIQCYQYICHKGEEGDKDHIHLRIEPNKSIDQMNITTILTEWVSGESKPRVVRPWRPSKEADWCMYVVHDEDYLALKYGGGDKGEKIPYKWQEIKCSENYDTEIMYIRAKQTLNHSQASIVKRLRSGEKKETLLFEGESVFMLNAVSHFLAQNDFDLLMERVQAWESRAKKAEQNLTDLIDALEKANVFVESNDDGSIRIEKS